MEEKHRVVIGVIGSDCHAVGNKIIDYALKDAGFEVTNVGVLSSQEDFINAALETNSEAILVSSLYGHGEIDCQGFKEKCQEAGLHDILLYIGGNIVVGKQDPDSVKQRFHALGFHRVFMPGQNIQESIVVLKKDLGML